jgi:hypothetical protein
MKTRSIVIAAALLAGMASPSFAVDGLRGTRIQSLVTKVTCDVRNEDKQALCAQKCDDTYISRKMNYGANQEEVKAEKKECDAKCGCPENSK